MAKNFSFRSLFIPATPRSKALRGKAGTVVVNNQSAGVPNTPATTVVNNYNITNHYTQEGGGVQVIRITIADLLALAPEQIQVSDIYAVHSSGSDESGWSKDEEFELYGKKYPDGSYAQYVDGVWLIADKDVVKTENEAIFNPLQKVVSLISKIFSQSSYSNLPGRSKAGIPIAEIRNYELDEAGVYQEKKESQTGTYAAETNVMTLLVPYARSYEQGGETQYSGGALTAADYKKLCEGGGGNVDDVQVDGVSVVENKVANIALSTYLNSYATQNWVQSQNYLTKIPSNVVDTDSEQVITGTKRFGSIETKFMDMLDTDDGTIYNFYGTDKRINVWVQKDPQHTQKIAYLSDIPSLSAYATQNWVNEQGFLKSVPSSYATQSWVNSQGFLKSIPSTYVQDSDMESYLEDYATESWVSSYINEQGFATQRWIEYQNYVTSDSLKGFVKTDGSNATISLSEAILTNLATANNEIKRFDITSRYNAFACVYQNPYTQAYEKKLLTFASIAYTFAGTELSDEDEAYDDQHFTSQKLFVDTIKEVKDSISEMRKVIVVTADKRFTVDELKGVAEVTIKPSGQVNVYLPSDATAIAGDRFTISIVPTNDTSRVMIHNNVYILFSGQEGQIATMDAVYTGSWKLFGHRFA